MPQAVAAAPAPPAKVADQLAARFGKRLGFFVVSGTAALELALGELGLRPGEEVLVPSLSCPAVGVAVLRAGGCPVFVPSTPALTLDLDWLCERVAGSEIVIVDHLYGMTVDVRTLRERFPALRIIEDTSKAWGATWQDIPVGTAGNLAVCSFGRNKPLDAGGGGGVFAMDDHAGRLLTPHAVETGQADVPWLPYGLPDWADGTIAQAVERADRKLAFRTRRASEVISRLTRIGLAAMIPAVGTKWSWNRITAHVPTSSDMGTVITEIEQMGLIVLRPRVHLNWELPVFKGVSKPPPARDREYLSNILFIKI